ERLTTRDIHPCRERSKVLAFALGANSGYNLYALARRGADFRWSYPDWLFRSGSPRRRVRDSFVRVGTNDAVQLGAGWWHLESWADGPMRWMSGRAEAFVRARGGERLLRLLVWGGPKERATDPGLTLRFDQADPTGPALSAQPVRVAQWNWVEFRLP